MLRLAGENPQLQELKVGDVMTRRSSRSRPRTRSLAAAALMAERRIRHLPVVQDGNVLGIVGLRDVARSLLELVWREHDGAARETARQLLKRA